MDNNIPSPERRLWLRKDAENMIITISMMKEMGFDITADPVQMMLLKMAEAVIELTNDIKEVAHETN